MKNRLIYAILSLLGLATACSKDDDGSVPCMYGTTAATFSVKGRVTDTEGKPIEGIRVIVGSVRTFTDAQGKFCFENRQVTGVDGDIFYEELEACDVDGEKNGSFQNNKKYVMFTRNDNVPSEGWYVGDYKAEDTDMVLQVESETE